MRSRANFLTKLATLAVLLGQFFAIPNAHADTSADCKIPISPWQTVSLGFPVAPERLVNFAKPKILVIPIKLKDTPKSLFTAEFKKDYENAAANIATFSNGKSTPEFIILPEIASDFTTKTFDDLRAVQQNANQWKDESVSTWGFVRKFIAQNDSTIDFLGINAVIIEGSSTSYNSAIAEAMMMSANPRDPYFRGIETNEGKIYNFSLLDKHQSTETITHEVMHLYGLTDLYGSNTGPGNLSLMASNQNRLLAYEKWVLGWLPDNQVQCLNNPTNKAISTITFDTTKAEQIFVVKMAGNTHFIIETELVRGVRKLFFYSLNNDLRPPIELFPSKVGNFSEGLFVDNFKEIGNQFISKDYTVLISDVNETSVVVNLVPSALIQTSEFSTLVNQATELNSKYQTALDEKNAAAALKAKQDAEVKAKEEAAAKVAAELKAKQETEAARVAAELKAKVEAAAKVAALPKKTTITCVKGKTTKKVTAINPKCPVGYSKK